MRMLRLLLIGDRPQISKILQYLHLYIRTRYSSRQRASILQSSAQAILLQLRKNVQYKRISSCRFLCRNTDSVKVPKKITRSTIARRLFPSLERKEV